MAEQPLHLRSDAELEAALTAFGDSVAWPEAAGRAEGPDLASVVRARIERTPRTVEPARPRWSWWPARRALVAAILVLLALAALAGAAGLGLPGLRLLLGPAPVSAPPSLVPGTSPTGGVPCGSPARPPGADLELGELVPLDELDARAGFAVGRPSDPALGPPDAAYVDPQLGRQVALVWASRDGLPETLAPGV